MFNQEPAEERDLISKAQEHEEEPWKKEGNAVQAGSSDCQNLKAVRNQNLDYKKEKSETDNQNEEFMQQSVAPRIQKSELIKRSCSEPSSQVTNCVDRSLSCPHGTESCRFSEESVDCLLQVDNGSEGDDGFLQREGSQRRSRRRFRRVNPRGERELITDGQEPASYNTVSVKQ